MLCPWRIPQENTKHSREEAKRGIDKLKEKHPKALLSEDEISAIVTMTVTMTMTTSDDGTE